jgi:hypothetical protein
LALMLFLYLALSPLIYQQQELRHLLELADG